MALERTKGKAVKRSVVLDQSKTVFALFCDRSLEMPIGSDAAYYQALVQSEDIQSVEVYGGTPANAENGTLEIGGKMFYTSNGEKRTVFDVMTEYSNTLDSLDYYIGKGVLFVTNDDNIRGIQSGNNITPYPLNQVDAGDKDPVNDGGTPNAPKLSITMDGKQAKKGDEWCLGFDFNSIINPSEETVFTSTNPATDSIKLTAKDISGNNVLDEDLGVINANISDYVIYSDDEGSSRVVTEIDATDGTITVSPAYGGSGTIVTVIIKPTLLLLGQAGGTLTLTT